MLTADFLEKLLMILVLIHPEFAKFRIRVFIGPENICGVADV